MNGTKVGLAGVGHYRVSRFLSILTTWETVCAQGKGMEVEIFFLVLTRHHGRDS